MKMYKIAKHVSKESHSCLHCGSFLTPRGLSRNQRHHFPIGIDYVCSCGESRIWTNSIRSNKDIFIRIIDGENIDHPALNQGFCNDRFCGFCHGHFGPLMNGLLLDSNKKPMGYDDAEGVEKYIDMDNLAEFAETRNPELLSDRTGLATISTDLFGCRDQNHNGAIIGWGYQAEYSEGEYDPIYQAIRDMNLNLEEIL